MGLLRLLRFWLLLRLCFVLCNYSVLCSSISSAPASIILSPFFRIPRSSCFFQSSSTFFCGLRLWLLLPVFLHVFTHATVLAAPPSLPLHFPLAAAVLALCGAAPVALTCCGFPGCGSSEFLFLCFPTLLSFFLSGLSQVSFLFHHFVSSACVLSLYVSSSSYFAGGFLCSGFCSSSAGVPFLALRVPTAFYGDSASFSSPDPFATWSPFGTSQVWLRPLFLSLVRVASAGLFHFFVGFHSVPLILSHLRFP